MSRIVGKVLVREAATPVPDVLVVVYDGGAHPTSTAAQPGGAAVDLDRSRRLASVITDRNGEFELDVEVETGPGPDLVLLVMAPEDSGSPSAPETTPVERVLHSTTFPRRSAADTENFVIRLRASQLDRLRIPHPVHPLAADAARELISRMDLSYALVEGAKERVAPRAERAIVEARSALGRANQSFKDFRPSALSPERRSRPTYFEPGKDLLDCQRKVARGTIDRARRAGAKVPLRLQVTADELNTLDVRDLDGRRTVSFARLMAHAQQRQKELVLYRRSSPLSGGESEYVDRIIHDIIGQASPGPDGASPLVIPELLPQDDRADVPLTPENLTWELVHRFLKEGSAPEQPRPATAARRPRQDDINAQVQLLELRGGPADATAFHDFEFLQIAFDHIRAEAVNEGYAQAGRKIMAGLLQEKQALGIDTDTGADVLIENFEQWKGFVEAAATERQAMHGERKRPWVMFACRRDDRECMRGQMQAGQEANEGNAGAAGDEAPPEFVALPISDTPLPYEPYAFDVFAPNSVNFGLLTTYRQEWTPLNFQVGDLVSTVPLAPKETRRYTVKSVVKKSRNRKESENALRIRKQDSDQTRRDDAEIVARAVEKTNFKLAAEGGATIGLAHVNASTGVETDSETTSAQTKKDFREAVLKAAEEYKQERHLELEVSESTESEEATSGEITNPNDELTVTYLLYELQRRYEIRERIHRLMPVVLVANEVPGQIDDAWLLRHDWILRRVLLDDTFQPVIDALTTRRGEELGLAALKENRDLQRSVVDDLKAQIGDARNRMKDALTEWQEAMQEEAEEAEEEEREGFFESVAEGLFGGDEDTDSARMRTGKTRTAFDLVEREVMELKARLDSAVNALEAANEKYVQAKIAHETRKKEHARLRTHVVQNIFYYMQAIWDHEPPDQRFFRLYDLPVPWMRAPVEDYRVDVVEGEDGQPIFEVEVPPGAVEEEERPLEQIADLDNLVGYKGNYLIFPLRQQHLFTWYMSLPFVDAAMGLRDPDGSSNQTTEELIDEFRRRFKKDPASFTEEAIDRWHHRILERLTSPRPEKDIVIVPTRALYIEALPGSRPLLEDFKLDHRELDVKKVQAEVRRAELENLRLAVRLLSGERTDPDVDKHVLVQGDVPVVVQPD